MSSETINQSFLFFIFIFNGVVIGIVFDIFRILRKSFKTSNIITYMEDVLFWIITGIILIYSIFVFNNGEIRGYMFAALILGILLYMLTISRYVIKVSVYIIQFIKKIIRTLLKAITVPLLYVLKGIRKIFIKPISFIFINLQNKSSRILKKSILIPFQNKKMKKMTKS